jgi:UDP-N-acetylglucosamine:LPS N-acetylglucosamine transferase
VITRGSATSLAEIDLYKKKKIIIPLPWSSQNHQFHNAMWYKENRDDIIIEERDMINTLPRTIKDTLKLDIVEKG